MIFLNSEKLADLLHQKKIDEIEQVRYLLASTFLFAIFSMPVYGAATSGQMSTAAIVLSVILWLCMWMLPTCSFIRANFDGDGKETIMRFTALSFPVAISFFFIGIFVFALMLLSAMVVITLKTGGIPADFANTLMYDNLFISVYDAIMIILLTTKMYKLGHIASGFTKY